MSHQRWHFVEKIQVEIAAAAALAGMYFLLWPTIRPWDVDGAVVFLPIEAGRHLLAFAGVVWLLAAICAVLTISARPEGALLAALIGVGGASIHSKSMRLLLMRYEDHMGRLMWPLVWELAAMAGMIVVALLVIHIVRAVVRLAAPGLMHRRICHRGKPTNPEATDRKFVTLDLVLSAVRDLFNAIARRGPLLKDKRKTPVVEAAVAALAAFGLTVLIGLAMLMITAFSTDRGQILFALAVSFFVSATLANYFFPAGFSAPCWLAPLVLGAAFYIRSCGIQPAGPLTWAEVQVWSNALPVDWLSAGCGGAVGGYWLSCRLHDLRHLPKEDDAPTRT